MLTDPRGAIHGVSWVVAAEKEIKWLGSWGRGLWGSVAYRTLGALGGQVSGDVLLDRVMQVALIAQAYMRQEVFCHLEAQLWTLLQ
eukprot:10728064-Lingulodinium_polyedra.AAC.1